MAPPNTPGVRPHDIFNSSATGHQRADSQPPVAWRTSRNNKLRHQFASSACRDGGARISDTYGQGAADFVPELNMQVSAAARARARLSVADMMRQPGTMQSTVRGTPQTTSVEKQENGQIRDAIASKSEDKHEERTSSRRRLFDGLVFYVNGSTHPVISDLKLKQLLAQNGARTSIHLGRRQVTHVIVGRPSTVGSGCGGGLAGGKLEKEIRRIGGCGIKYISAEWVLDSIKAGKRLPEARYGKLKVATAGQSSVYNMFNGTQT